MIISAPGKIVLWGEYAVLAGAPAAVMAIDRYASCALKVRSMFSSFVAHGFLTPGLSTPERVVPSVPVTSVFVAVLKEIRAADVHGTFSEPIEKVLATAT